METTASRSISIAGRRRAAVAASLAVLLLTTGLAGTSAASHVGCGAVITQDTTLDSNIGPCASHGIIVGADGVTLDLNGHYVSGVGVPGDGTVGVLVEGRKGVTVTNGTVRDFDAGVAIEGGANHTIDAITARNNVGGALSPYGDGIAINNATNTLVVNSVAQRNGPFSGIGLFGTSSNNTIQGNTVVDNDLSSMDDGIRLEPGTSHNTVVGNVVRRNGLDGIAVFARSTHNYVAGNVVEDNGFHMALHRKGDGIRVFSTGDFNRVEDNDVFDNAASGIRVDSQHNEIVGNRTGRNALNTGGRDAYDLHDTNADCDANTWSGNTFGTAFPDCTTG